jgi:phage baseplate assembly protein V
MAIRELVELASRLTEIERRMAGMMRHGTVAEVDPATQRVRLDFGPAHGSDGRFLSPWVPYAQFSGALRVHTPPTVGQQFTAMSPAGDFRQAVAVPLTHHSENPSPSGAGDQNVVTYGNVAMTLADDLVRCEVGGLSFELTSAQAQITVGGVAFKVSGAGVEITGGTITHNGTDVGDTHTHTDTPGLGSGTTSPPN